MEPFNKILSREQSMQQHTKWRNTLAFRHGLRFGLERSIMLTLRCRISFDVQLPPHEAARTVKNFQRRAGMPLFALISIQ